MTTIDNLKNRELIIDCEPLMPRPDVYYKEICKNILHTEPKEPISKLFGEWIWKVDYDSEEQRNKVGEYLKSCYKSKLIRYGEW